MALRCCQPCLGSLCDTGGCASQVEAGLTDLQQAYEQLHRDLAGARGADERRTLEQHVRDIDGCFGT